MSLDVASAVLSTNWAELGTVGFTAGTLSTLSTCIDEVGVKLKRGAISATSTPTDASVAGWLSRAKQELAEVKKFTWRRRYATCTTTGGTYRYSLPPDYGGGYLSIRDLTNDRNLKIVDEHTFNTFFPDNDATSNDEPRLACIKNLELWLAPPPAGAYTLEAEYERTGDDATPGDFSWLPELERWRCVDFATREGFRSLHQWAEAQIYDNEWIRGLGKAVKADGKRKWSQMEYRCKDFWNG